MFYQMNSFMLANELVQYFRNTSIATAVIHYDTGCSKKYAPRQTLDLIFLNVKTQFTNFYCLVKVYHDVCSSPNFRLFWVKAKS